MVSGKKKTASTVRLGQRALEQLGLLPLLKDPNAAVGKELELIGSYWGNS